MTARMQTERKRNDCFYILFIKADLLKLENVKSGAALHRNQSASGFYCQSLLEQVEVRLAIHYTIFFRKLL
ncbi:unnamed protein product [Staurois parvus]|uniref:Uncharacterized protein n=1 Tax=Staurois parvus TaxID=386267 RepID=A0ABN9AKM3_9NEOB|nr:unnamed protein product [Staurois parvus]